MKLLHDLCHVCHRMAFLLVLAAATLVVASCAGSPKQAANQNAPQAAAPLALAVEEPAVEPPPLEAADEIPLAEETQEDELAAAEIDEVEIDLPEAGATFVPPPEPALPGTLPEPSAPLLALPPEPAPPPLAPPAPVTPPVPAPPPLPPPEPPKPVPSRPAQPSRPQPPAFLGPADDERPPALASEPSPAPDLPTGITPISPPQKTAPDEEISFSRTVRATVGQLVEIPFRGTGWVFLGELGARRGINYDSRRLDPEGQSFVFRAEDAGTYALKFYKQDFVRDFILNDYVQVIVGDSPAARSGWFNAPPDQSRVIAEPRWPSSLEEAVAPKGSSRPPLATAPATPAPASEAPAVSPAAPVPATPAPAQPTAPVPRPPVAAPSNDEGVVQVRPPVLAGGTAPQTAPAATPVSPATNVATDADAPLSPDSSPAAFFQKAREEFEAGRVAQAIACLDQFRERYPSGSDEAYWLYGQFYEANSPSRDMLTALDYYRRLVREYPQSGRYNDARRRIAYLERYYINIQ